MAEDIILGNPPAAASLTLGIPPPDLGEAEDAQGRADVSTADTIAAANVPLDPSPGSVFHQPPGGSDASLLVSPLPGLVSGPSLLTPLMGGPLLPDGVSNSALVPSRSLSLAMFTVEAETVPGVNNRCENGVNDMVDKLWVQECSPIH